MVKLMRAMLIFVFAFFAVSCSNDASVTELESSASNEVIVGDDGEVLDEIPVDDIEEEVIAIVEGDDLENPDEEPEVIEEEEEVEIVEEEEIEEEEDDKPVVTTPPAGNTPPACEKRASLELFKLDSSEKSLGDIQAFKGPFSTRVNYNYYSASAHPIIGPHPEEYEGHFFFYEGSDGLSLNFFYNIDAGGSSNNKVKMDIEVKGNAASDEVMISDDGSELKAMSDGSYQAKMHYWYNTDGGAIGPLEGKEFKIHVKMYDVGDNKRVAFYSADGRSILLENISDAPSLYSEFVISYNGEKPVCDSGVDSEAASCLKDAYARNEEALKDSAWRAKWKKANQDRKDKLSALAADQRAKVRAVRDEFNAKRKSLKDEIMAAKKVLRAKIKEKRAALNQEIKDARKALSAALKKKRKDVLNAHKEELKAFKGDKKDKAELRNHLSEKRKAVHAEHKKIMKNFNLEAKKRRAELNKKIREHLMEFHKHAKKRMKEFDEDRKAAMKELCAMFRAERKHMASELLKKIRADRAKWMVEEKDVRESFVKEVMMCKKK